MPTRYTEWQVLRRGTEEARWIDITKREKSLLSQDTLALNDPFRSRFLLYPCYEFCAKNLRLKSWQWTTRCRRGLYMWSFAISSCNPMSKSSGRPASMRASIVSRIPYQAPGDDSAFPT